MLARQRLGRDACNLAVDDAHVAGGVEARLRVQDAAAIEHEVVSLGEGGSGGKEQY
jgi:hypothetical protein